MARKIPGKKHRGVKDPLKQQAKRLAELEKKINAPPKDVEEQAVPKSLERVIQLKDAVKTGRIGKKTKRKRQKNRLICVGAPNSKSPYPKDKADKIVPVFKQRPGENGNAFYHRVCRQTQSFLNEAAFEKKYNVEINRNPETGEIEGVSKRSKDEIDELEKLRAKHKNVKKKKKVLETDGTPKLSKADKRKQKLQMKKDKKFEETANDFERFRDRVEFGEVAHAPPQLKARPRKADATNSNKPGKKDLLLSSLLKEAGLSRSERTTIATIDRSGKRKNLPVGERKRLEEQQRDVIAAYRSLKAQRSADS